MAGDALPVPCCSDHLWAWLRLLTPPACCKVPSERLWACCRAVVLSGAAQPDTATNVLPGNGLPSAGAIEALCGFAAGEHSRMPMQTRGLSSQGPGCMPATGNRLDLHLRRLQAGGLKARLVNGSQPQPST